MRPVLLSWLYLIIILKPIDDEELNDSLKRAVRKLDKKHSLENQKINTVKAMMTVAITNHRDDTVGNITESEKEPVKRGLVMIGALKGEPSKALLERVETLTYYLPEMLIPL